MKPLVSKLSNPDNMITQKENTVCLAFKIIVPHKFYPLLDKLYIKSKKCVERMLKNRNKSSSKYYKTIPCVVSKSLISKYQKNKKLKKVTNLVLPICGDRGRQIKIEGAGIRVPTIFKKEVIQVPFPKPITGFIRQVEFFKRNKVWFMSYSYNVKTEKEKKIKSYLGVDRNSVGNVVTIADISTGKERRIGPSTADITNNFRNRRRKLQKKGANNALVKIKRKQSRRVKDINHKVSRTVVDYAKLHCSAIVLEDLGKISKKGKAKRYVQKSQWSFYQLETFIKYKVTLLGVPIFYVNPAYTSQECSKCGSRNKPNGKHYKCSKCEYFCHRDVNAAFNISKRGDKTLREKVLGVGHIGRPLNQRPYKGGQLESLGGVQ